MVYEKIAAMLAEKLECEVSEIQKDTKFEELGIDSLDITELVMNMEDEFGIQVEITTAITTVGELAQLIESQIQ